MADEGRQLTAITLCGSLRKGSINEVLRRHMSAKLREAGVTVTDLPIKLTLAAGAPKGEYTFVLKAYDDAGEPSAESTAKVTLQ